jgi:hypothetical protein
MFFSGYRFRKGMHPFFPWPDFESVDHKVGRNSATFTIKLRSEAKPSKLRLDVPMIDELLELEELQEQTGHPLLTALREARARFA